VFVIKQLKDGKILFTMTASGKEEIKAWILSFGAKVKVFSHKFLREEIKEDISRTLAFYRSHPE
jgi:predicted DNA-binding transcriptional regulator YafY